MSEQANERKQHFMQQLDQWTEGELFRPVFELGVRFGKGAETNTAKRDELMGVVKQVVRDKTYDSWQRGREAGVKSKRKEG